MVVTSVKVNTNKFDATVGFDCNFHFSSIRSDNNISIGNGLRASSYFNIGFFSRFNTGSRRAFTFGNGLRLDSSFWEFLNMGFFTSLSIADRGRLTIGIR